MTFRAAPSYPLSFLSVFVTLWLVVAALVSGCSGGGQRGSEQLADREYGGSWTMFRGDRSLSGNAAGKLADKLRLLWSFDAGDEIVSSAVVDGGVVYIGSGDGNVYAIDQNKGTRRWSFDAGDRVEAPPLLLDDTVYVGALNGRFYALNAETGEKKWQYKTGDMIAGSATWISSPEGNRVIVGSHDFHLYCLDASSGGLKWRYETEYYVNGAPAIVDDKAIIGGCDEVVHVVRALSGDAIANISVDSYIAASCSSKDGSIFVGHYDNQLICVDVAEEKIVWEYGDRENGDPFFSSPAVAGNRVIIGCRDGNVHCVDSDSGKRLWVFRAGGPVDSSPVVCDGKVVVGCDDGRLYILGLEDGTKIWSYDIGAEIAGSPAVVDGMIIVGAYDGKVYAFVGK